MPDLSLAMNTALAHNPAFLPDTLIRGGRVVNFKTGQILHADVTILNGVINGVYQSGYPFSENIDPSSIIEADGKTLVPGFINTHLHVESSLVTPQQYERMVLPRGTTTIVCDPHEMANVVGTPAFDFFLASADNMTMDMRVGLSSCVPATDLGTSGANIDAMQLAQYKDRPHTVGLAEMMNLGGLYDQDPEVMEKLRLFKGNYIGGHIPVIDDEKLLNMYVNAGILDDHESSALAAARLKLQLGIHVLIREGTAGKNLEALAPLINPVTAASMAFCTDDRDPLDVQNQGEMDYIIRKAIALYDPGFNGPDREQYIIAVYRMASLSAAENFMLNSPGDRRGFIGPSWNADIVILDDLETCQIHSVLKSGVVVNDKTFMRYPAIDPARYSALDTVIFHGRDAITTDDLKLSAPGEKTTVPIIGVVNETLITEFHEAELNQDEHGNLLAAPEEDILKMVVVERHGVNGNIGIGFVKGFGLQNGALASSVGHDDHNITAVGSNDEDIVLAVNTLKEKGGGFVLVQNGKLQTVLPLPVAGLMSDQPWEVVAEMQKTLRAQTEHLGTKITEPFMALAFLSLSVIPNLKLTDKGLTRFAPPADHGPSLIWPQPNALV